MLKVMLVTTALAGAVAATPALAQRGGWETIGSLRVNNRVERDELRVRGNERFRAIRLCNTASRKDIRLLDVDVVFANGAEQDIGNENWIRAGRCGVAYDLRGRTRNVERVRLAYAKSGVRGRDPVLTVQAR